jgi:TolA-binding protein
MSTMSHLAISLTGKLKLRFGALACIAVLLSGFYSSVFADLAGSGLTPDQERELQFVDKLLDEGMPTHAAFVLQRIQLPPEVMAIREIRSLTARGEFEKAEAIVASNSGKTQQAMSLKLALADGYYVWGQYQKAQALYDEFFKAFPQGPDAAMKSFFINSAYRYAKMLELMGNRKGAADAYRTVLRATPERHVTRQIQSELAELLVLKARDASAADRKRLLAEVQKIAEEILWVQDLWFGRAIVLLAHVRVMEGDLDGAMQLVQDYTPQLREIDRILREQAQETGEDFTRLSPMAQCRYLIGEIMHNRALEILDQGGNKQEALGLLIGRRTAGGRDVDGAVQHFLNVFIRYPNTSWAPQAGNRFRQVEALLEKEFGRRIETQITRAQWEEVERAQFREARSLFNQGRFADAVDNYLQVLMLFPERGTSMPALGELGLVFIELQQYDFAEAVAGHLADRFCMNEEHMVEAGNQVIRIAMKFLETNQRPRHDDIYARFLARFRRHPRTILDLQRFAREAMQKGDRPTAILHFSRIVEDFAGHPAYWEALSSLARLYRDQEDLANKARMLQRLITELDQNNLKNHFRISAAYRMADMFRGAGPGQADRAQQLYRDVRQRLEGADASSYAATPAEIERNQFFLEGSIFFHAMIDAMRAVVPENIQRQFNERAQGRAVPPQAILNNHYKVGAIRLLTELVDRYPQSVFAPPALSQIGALNTILQRPEDAAAALRRLERQYPDSPEAANAVFAIGLSLLEMGRREDAVRYFSQMFAGTGTYAPAQLLRAGQELLAAKEYPIALQAFERVIAGEDDRRFQEPARVGKGQALFGLERFREAASWFDGVIAAYPQSGLTIVINRTASEANAAVANQTESAEERTQLFNRSVEQMRRAMQFAQDNGTRAQLEVSVASVLERRADAELRFGTPQRSQQFRNESVAAYQTIMMFRDASDPAVAPHIQTAFSRAVPMMVAMERWQDVYDDASAYLEKFPNGPHAGAMRDARTRAQTFGDITGRTQE